MGAVAEIDASLRSRGIAAEDAARLAAYAELVLEANRKINLTAAREPAQFVEQILDALTLRPYVDGKLVDLGSGAGLPGIPLAIVTGRPVTLVDSIKKKTAFLERVVRSLGLDASVISDRAERLGSDPAFREQYDLATARAVSSAPTVAELAVPFLRIGGRALLQRGSMSLRERQAVIDAAPILGAKVVEEVELQNERRILVLQKLSLTQARFPRREGIPEKRPLCYGAGFRSASESNQESWD